MINIQDSREIFKNFLKRSVGEDVLIEEDFSNAKITKGVSFNFLDVGIIRTSDKDYITSYINVVLSIATKTRQNTDDLASTIINSCLNTKEYQLITIDGYNDVEFDPNDMFYICEIKLKVYK